MKENRNKGTAQYAILAVVFLFIGFTWLFMKGGFSGLGSAKSLYTSGRTYLHDTDASKHNTYAIEAYEVYGPIAKVSGNRYWYLVGLEDGYYCLETSRWDSKIAKLAKTGGELETPVYLKVKVDEDITNDFKNFLAYPENIFGEGNPTIWAENILVHQSFFASNFMDTLIFLICMGLVVYFIFLAFKVKGDNAKSYEVLYERFPELKDNLDIIETNSEYADNTIKVYVYKGFLIINSTDFNVVDLSTVRWVYKLVNTTKYSGATVGVNLYINIFTEVNGRHSHKKYHVLNIQNYSDVAIDRLIMYIGDRYPDVLLGFSTETQQAYRQLKKG